MDPTGRDAAMSGRENLTGIAECIMKFESLLLQLSSAVILLAWFSEFEAVT